MAPNKISLYKTTENSEPHVIPMYSYYKVDSKNPWVIYSILKCVPPSSHSFYQTQNAEKDHPLPNWWFKKYLESYCSFQNVFSIKTNYLKIEKGIKRNTYSINDAAVEGKLLKQTSLIKKRNSSFGEEGTRSTTYWKKGRSEKLRKQCLLGAKGVAFLYSTNWTTKFSKIWEIKITTRF